MPANAAAVLQQKIMGVPLWLAGAGLIGAFFLVRKLGLFGGAATSAQPAAATPNQGIPPGFVPSSEVGLPSAAPPAATTTSTMRTARVAAPWDNIVTVQPQGSGAQATVIGRIPNGAKVTITGDPVTALWGSEQFQAVPVSYLGSPVGYASLQWLQEVSGMGGIGGPGTVRGGRAGGSRTAVLMHAGHPLLKQRVRFPHHYVIGRGGPSSLHDVARQAGVHPARLIALNPHLRSQGYEGRPGQIIRIA